MPGLKADRLLAAGSVRRVSPQSSNVELALWIFILATSLLALAFWGS